MKGQRKTSQVKRAQKGAKMGKSGQKVFPDVPRPRLGALAESLTLIGPIPQVKQGRGSHVERSSSTIPSRCMCSAVVAHSGRFPEGPSIYRPAPHFKYAMLLKKSFGINLQSGGRDSASFPVPQPPGTTRSVPYPGPRDAPLRKRKAPAVLRGGRDLVPALVGCGTDHVRACGLNKLRNLYTPEHPHMHWGSSCPDVQP